MRWSPRVIKISRSYKDRCWYTAGPPSNLHSVEKMSTNSRKPYILSGLGKRGDKILPAIYPIFQSARKFLPVYRFLCIPDSCRNEQKFSFLSADPRWGSISRYLRAKQYLGRRFREQQSSHLTQSLHFSTFQGSALVGVSASRTDSLDFASWILIGIFLCSATRLFLRSLCSKGRISDQSYL